MEKPGGSKIGTGREVAIRRDADDERIRLLEERVSWHREQIENYKSANGDQIPTTNQLQVFMFPSDVEPPTDETRKARANVRQFMGLYRGREPLFGEVIDRKNAIRLEQLNQRRADAEAKQEAARTAREQKCDQETK